MKDMTEVCRTCEHNKLITSQPYCGRVCTLPKDQYCKYRDEKHVLTMYR